jgi:hypothetical protein
MIIVKQLNVLKTQGFNMGRDKEKDILISDTGIKTSRKGLYSSIFVTICRILSVVLVILGVLAFVTGNF